MQNQIPNHEMTSKSALNILKEGNKRFVENHMVEHDLLKEVRITATRQQPFALVLNCFDSRVPAELIFDQGIGDIFNTRIGGNIINNDIIGCMEFACKFVGVKLILVLGHTSCKAIKGACDKMELGKLSELIKKIEPAVEAVKTLEGVDRSSKNDEFVNRVAQKNVELTIENIKTQSHILREMIENDEIDLVGSMYDISTGEVKFGV
tara:strand:+ start:37 stop:657 length:621 start_codon:yes stop_codon:yes gene_type:complete